MSEAEGIHDGTYVVSFDDTRAVERALVGGKGANLARLSNAGLPVPEGFCVTTIAYEELIDDPVVRDAVDELSSLDPTDTVAIANAGRILRARIEELDVPAEIRGAIEDALEAMATDPGETYAVRSSATAEDLPDASFAGQQETFLNVPGDAIVDRVRDCMASLFTDRAITYRARNEIPHGDVALAVVVQRMVTPDVAGITFTADPQTGNRHVASVEAAIGLGEALVSGEATADDVRIDKRTGEILEYTVGDQQVAVRPRSKGGVETGDLGGRDDPLLSDERVQALVDIGTEIEELFDTPQDIEWCLKDGEFYVVQARPITSLFPVPSPEPDDDRLHVYYSFGHAQVFSEAMPPLVRDLWRTYITETMAELGVEFETPLMVEAGGRLYFDMTMTLDVGFLRRRMPDTMEMMSEDVGAAIDDLLTRRSDEFQSERTLRQTLAVLPRVVGAMWTSTRKGFPMMSANVVEFVESFIGEPNPPEAEEAKWTTWGRTVAAQMREPNTPAERACEVFDFSDELLQLPTLGTLYAAIVAEACLKRLFPNAPEAVNDVGRGLPDDLVTRINLGLGDLADVARDHPAVADALRQDSSLREIESCEGGDAFLAALDEYLDEFGHRATGEIDASRPRWRDDPSGLLATVRANLEHGEKGDHRKRLQRLEREANAAAEALERRADHGVFGPIRKRLVRRLIRTYRSYIQTREYPKQGFGYLFTAWHEILRDAGELLADDGVLADSDDVWFLRSDELVAALEGNSIDVDIAARRAEFERYTDLSAPPVLTSEGEVPGVRSARDDLPEGVLVGTGVSGGVVEGRARIVRDPAKETIEEGEILIAPSLDPGWTPSFLNAAGVVVEVGTRTSHGAIVAREYGLPAVVSVPEATRQIETGQRVRVDGTNGTIEIIE